MVLLFGIFLLWSTLNTPSREELLERKRVQDSIAMAQQVEIAKPDTELTTTADTSSAVSTPEQDSTRKAAKIAKYGAFASNTIGTEKQYVLENDKIKVTLSNKGGRITDVLLKDYKKILLDEKRKEYFAPLHMLDDKKNVFEYILPDGNQQIHTGDLFFDATENNGTVTFTAQAADGAVFTQTYALSPDSYTSRFWCRTCAVNSAAVPATSCTI